MLGLGGAAPEAGGEFVELAVPDRWRAGPIATTYWILIGEAENVNKFSC